MGTLFIEDLLLRLPGSTASHRWDEEILEEESLHLNPFSLPIINLDQTNKFLTRKKDASLKGECAKFRWSLAIARSVWSSAIALS